MRELMAAVAETLRNMGVEATSGYDYVEIAGVQYECRQRWNRKTFTFLGRTYKTGNTLQAVMDLLIELPKQQARREAALREQRNVEKATELSRRLRSMGMAVTYYAGKFILQYTCEDIDDLVDVSTKLQSYLEAASDAEWQELLAIKPTTIARFTAEGGFSLN